MRISRGVETMIDRSGDEMKSKAINFLLLFLALSAVLSAAPSAHAQSEVSLWLTNPDRSALFQLQTPPIPFSKTPATNQIIDVDPAKTYRHHLLEARRPAARRAARALLAREWARLVVR
jgi:hypothetical protein